MLTCSLSDAGGVQVTLQRTSLQPLQIHIVIYNDTFYDQLRRSNLLCQVDSNRAVSTAIDQVLHLQRVHMPHVRFIFIPICVTPLWDLQGRRERPRTSSGKSPTETNLQLCQVDMFTLFNIFPTSCLLSPMHTRSSNVIIEVGKLNLNEDRRKAS